MLTREDLFVYQRRAVEFIKQTPNCALFLDPGLGKTCSTLTALDDLMAGYDIGHALVIAPLRVARKVWPDEVREWKHLKDLSVKHIGGTAKERLAAMRTRAHIHTIGRENTQWLVDQYIDGKKLIRRWPWDTVVLDESQSFASQSAKRWKAMKLARQCYSRCIELTGTPVPNGYGQLWSQMYLLDRGKRLGASETAYRNRWFDADMGDNYVNYTLRKGAKDEIHAAIADIVLSLRAEDWFELPPVMYNRVRVTLSPEALKTYRKFARQSVYAAKDGKLVTAVNAGAVYNKCLQLANGAIYLDDQRNYELFHDEKIDALLELCESVSGPTLIGYAYVSDKERICQALTQFCGKTKRWGVMDSDADLERFARGELDFGVLHPASAGHGLNDMHKSGAKTIIWFGLTANYEWFKQLNDRLAGGIRRIGRNVVVHMILADDTKDAEVAGWLTEKEATDDGLKRAMVKAVAKDSF